MTTAADPTFLSWLATLERRHLADLEFAEVRRGLQALSSWYVERRATARRGVAFDGRGKRAAFALFYTPLHYLTVSHVIERLPAAARAVERITDLGCGTGPAGAAWSRAVAGRRAPVSGVDTSGWALGEARFNWARLEVDGAVRRGDLTRTRLATGRHGIVAAWAVNELPPERRETLRTQLLDAAERGAALLIVEPIARGIAPWWDDWAAAFERHGGRADSWRIECELPEPLRSLDRAAGLDHRELTARSLFVQSIPST